MANPLNMPRPQRSAWFYRQARKGYLNPDFVQSFVDAQWALDGWKSGVRYGNLKGEAANAARSAVAQVEARFAEAA